METGAEHPGGRTLTVGRAGERAIGIDLGTTNSALAWSGARGPIRIFHVPQLVALGEMGRQPTLPSFLYFATEAERASGGTHLPWSAGAEVIAGVVARDHGALVPARQIASTKSWLSNGLVDRTAPLLPWGADGGRKLSPVDASARLLVHLRDGWNHEHADGGDSRLETLPIVLTVPASFDEEARELTVAAARQVGFERLTLLEEPLAALYAWIASHRRTLGETFGTGALVLVCDVGGGTTDFSLIRAAVDLDVGDLTFERIAIGEHLLLGGDNLDLALAAAVEQKFGDRAALTLIQRQTLRRKCSDAKERLLSDPASERVPITVLGSGRGVVGQGLTTELTRDEVMRALAEGFLPLTGPEDLPARDRRAGLRELGLPYETEPAITRHLAAFLTRAAPSAGTGRMARPDAVLFNGGFFTPSLARNRVVDALAGWFGTRPAVLDTERPESAVAMGAAFYGRLRQTPDLSRRLLIRAGSARAYYIGVGGGADEVTQAVCVMARGTQEGTRLELDREFTVIANQPAAFTLYSATDRLDSVGAVVAFPHEEEAQRHAPLVTALRYGKRSRRVPLAVRLTTVFTETGTLELWCESKTSEHRWRLGFNLRAVEADVLEEAVAQPEAASSGPGVIIAEGGVVRAEALLRAVFTKPADRPAPEALTGELEQTLGHGRLAWPIDTIRTLADVLLELAAGRGLSAGHEVRWMNLTGFCVRPGFGSALDPWRVSELRKVYLAGLAFPRDVQCQVEWLVLWQRTAAGFSTGQQRELATRVSGQLGIGQRKPPRLNAQIERESWRVLGGLERLDATHRAALGDDLLERVRRDPRNAAWCWTLGRFGARTPLYGPLNTMVPPAVAERWIDRLLGLKHLTRDAAAAVIQIGARTGDPARDISEAVAEAAVARVRETGVDAAAADALRVPRAPDREGASHAFGESLPEGLRLA
jgi:molecular chaperone DnaK (HSP70)